MALFEVGQIFLGSGDADQRVAAAGVRRGLAKAGEEGRNWRGGGPVDAFDAKADAMALLAALGVANAVQVAPGGPAFLHPGRSATLQFGPKLVVGWFGQLHPSVCEALDADGPIVAFEIVLDAVPAPKARPTKAKPKLDRSDFMPVERDLAFVVAEGVRAGDVLKAAQGAERTLISNIDVFDVYQGKGLPEGTKSIAIAVTLQPRERTLTDAEIEAAVATIVAEVAKKTGAASEGLAGDARGAHACRRGGAPADAGARGRGSRLRQNRGAARLQRVPCRSRAARQGRCGFAGAGGGRPRERPGRQSARRSGKARGGATRRPQGATGASTWNSAFDRSRLGEHGRGAQTRGNGPGAAPSPCAVGGPARGAARTAPPSRGAWRLSLGRPERSGGPQHTL